MHERTPEADIQSATMWIQVVPIKNLKLDCENNSLLSSIHKLSGARGYNIFPPHPFTLLLSPVYFKFHPRWGLECNREIWLTQLNSTPVECRNHFSLVMKWMEKKTTKAYRHHEFHCLFSSLALTQHNQIQIYSVHGKKSQLDLKWCNHNSTMWMDLVLFFSTLLCLFQADSHRSASWIELLLGDISLTFKWTNRIGSAQSFIDHQSSMCCLIWVHIHMIPKA
jgi:hypothetical protein